MKIKQIISSTIGQHNTQLVRSFFKSSAEKKEIVKRRAFYSQLLNEGDVYFDVGANYGNRIEPIIDLGIKIVAVEPQESCVKYLQKKFKDRIHIVNKGLGEKEEEKTMYISSLHVLSSFSKEFIEKTKESGRFKNHNWNKTKKVQITTLDHLITQYGKPKFIKIDVEGFELEVLKGLSQEIDCISIEYTVPEETDKLIQCIDILKTLNGTSIKFNYSIGESMDWAMEEWKNYTDFIAHIKTDAFIKTNFGDVYISSAK